MLSIVTLKHKLMRVRYAILVSLAVLLVFNIMRYGERVNLTAFIVVHLLFAQVVGSYLFNKTIYLGAICLSPMSSESMRAGGAVVAFLCYLSLSLY